MKRYRYKVTLLEPVVLSRTAATVGVAETLDFIPGSVLLGVFARQWYGKWRTEGDLEKARMVFESDQVRFGPAYPCVDGKVSLPIPLSWHSRKGALTKNAERQVDNGVRDLSGLSWLKAFDGDQPVQMREGYFSSETRRFAQVQRGQVLKTAIDQDRRQFNRSAESQLFGYRYLQAGASFEGCIECDSDDGLEIKNFDGARIELARSKGVEFGSAQLEISLVENAPNTPNASGDLLTAYAESDWALLDRWGNPTVEPEASFFGLTGWEIVPEKSFLRFRRYRPWNAKRHHRDLERVVVSRGSVVVFRRSQENGDREQGLPSWVGGWNREGLGMVRWNPKFLSNEWLVQEIPWNELDEEPGCPAAVREKLKKEVKNNFVLARYEAREDAEVARFSGQEWADKWLKFQSPSATQWGRLRSLATKSKDVAGLRQSLTGVKGLFIHGVRAKDWKTALQKAILDSLDGVDQPKQKYADDVILAACRIAAESMRQIQIKKGGDNE